MDLVVAARIDEQRRPGVERLAGVLRRGGDRPELPQLAEPRHRQDEVVRELEERTLDAEVGVEREREHDRVRRHVAAGVIADEQHGSGLRDVAEPADLAPVPQAGGEPQHRQVLPDVVRVTLVEIGPRDPPRRLVGDLAQQATDERRP